MSTNSDGALLALRLAHMCGTGDWHKIIVKEKIEALFQMISYIT